MKPLRLATYNLRHPSDPPPYDWPSRLPRVLALLEEDGFDVFGTQEGKKGQLFDIVANTRYRYVGGGRDDFIDGGEHCAIFYDPERLELVKGGTFALSETPDIPGSKSWDTCAPRIATWAFFRDQATGREFCYYNTHLDHISVHARIEGIRLVLAHAGENCGGVPLVLTGDLNDYPGSETLDFAESRLRNARALAARVRRPEPPVTWHGWGRDFSAEPHRLAPIDFIFVSDGVKVEEYFVDDRKFLGDYASDHYPVAADLLFPE